MWPTHSGCFTALFSLLNLYVNLTQKHPHRHTSIMFNQNIWASLGLVELPHGIKCHDPLHTYCPDDCYDVCFLHLNILDRPHGFCSFSVIKKVKPKSKYCLLLCSIKILPSFLAHARTLIRSSLETRTWGLFHSVMPLLLTDTSNSFGLEMGITEKGQHDFIFLICYCLLFFLGSWMSPLGKHPRSHNGKCWYI